MTLIFCICVGSALRHSEGEEESSAQSSVEDNISEFSEPSTYVALNYESVKAVWLSQFDMRDIYTDGYGQRDIGDYTDMVERVIKNIRSLGMNTVFIQLRPNGDSIYPSELYPTSKYLTGAYGRESDYDVFSIFLERAHLEGISVHAWINPLRCMSESEIGAVSLKYDIRRWYSDGGGRIKSVGGVCYLDPAYSEVRSLICDGVLEILGKYEIDGIHIDDYFYPTTELSFDAEVYGEYREAGGILSLADFRREQINTLVRDIYATVKRVNHTVLFGVSPSGNTDGNYNELYADVAMWCASEGYIDYICPQVYFGFEHESRPFDAVCEEFADMIKTDSVSLIVGMTLEKAYNGYGGEKDVWAGTGASEWIENRDILKRSLEYAQTIKNCQGSAFFSYRYFFDPISGEPLGETWEELSKILPLL